MYVPSASTARRISSECKQIFSPVLSSMRTGLKHLWGYARLQAFGFFENIPAPHSLRKECVHIRVRTRKKKYIHSGFFRK